MRLWLTVLMLCLFLCGCDTSSEVATPSADPSYYTYTAVERLSSDRQFTPKPPQWTGRPSYSWERRFAGKYPRITKDFFRCRGSEINPIRFVHSGGNQAVCHRDCGGGEKHSLPLRDGKEFVYPVLIELLNYLQETTDSQVVITSGHRCPLHNTYVDATPENRASKHQVGAAVAFYVQGYEYQPEKIIDLIREYYKSHPEWKDNAAFTNFSTYQKKTDVSTPPLMNKEVLVKTYNAEEGRNFDNRHPYPYLQVQVRWDRDTKKPVNYTWHGAHRNYHRW